MIDMNGIMKDGGIVEHLTSIVVNRDTISSDNDAVMADNSFVNHFMRVLPYCISRGMLDGDGCLHCHRPTRMAGGEQQRKQYEEKNLFHVY